MQSSIYLTKGFCQSQGADVTVKGFRAFLDRRRQQGLRSNQFLKISNCLKTYSISILGAKMSHSPPELPSGHVKGQQLQQHRIQFPQRQMANVPNKC